MTNDARDPMELVRKLTESYSGIKFGRGVVGKTSQATIALFVLWSIVLLRLSGNVFLDIALFLGGVIATAIYLWWVSRTQAFATANPDLALLEGAELIEYKKWVAEINGKPLLRSDPIPNPQEIEFEGKRDQDNHG